MKRPIAVLLAALAGGILMLGIQVKAQPEAAEPVEMRAVENPLLVDREEALKNFAADSDPDRAIYLSALQAMEIAHRTGDFASAEKLLNRIAGECPRQSVRTAIRRLLVAHYAENGDAASARTNLETIVAENLHQM